MQRCCQDGVVPRRRVSLKESFQKATHGPAQDRDHYSSGLVAVWYWIVGEPVTEIEAVQEASDEVVLAELARASLLLPVTQADLGAYNALVEIGEVEAAMEELERVALPHRPAPEFWERMSAAASELGSADAAARYLGRR